MKKYIRGKYFLALFVFFWLIYSGCTYSGMQGRGYTAEGIGKILQHPNEYLYSIWVTTNMPVPRILIPNSVATSVKVTIHSSDGKFAWWVVFTGTLIILFIIYAVFTFWGKSGEEGGKAH